MGAPYDDQMAAELAAQSNADATHYDNFATHFEAVRMFEEQVRIDNDNISCLMFAEQTRKTKVDFASLGLATVSFLLYDRYYDKYQDVIQWRDGIADRIKDCLEQDVDHYIDVVMSQMNAAIGTLLSQSGVVVTYGDTINRYQSYGDSAAVAANSLIQDLNHKNCQGCPECNQCGDDLKGWATMNAISAADDRVRFDEARVPRRYDVISAAVDSAHSSTFNLPALDYQALSNAAEISSSLAAAYAGITNSALGSAGYFSSNFTNSL